ncbi:MAG: GGDEF domain-containing protein [Sphaerobacteraceae bacterium]|nr:MAG: GGDEF domain-containing protein [Sphaerobacteraceae bacterium]
MFWVGLILLYVPPLIYLVTTGSDPHNLVAHALILFGALVSTVVPLWVARVRLPYYSGSDQLLVRESRGWYLIALAGLLMLAARSIYAWHDLVLSSPDSHVPIAYALTRLSFLTLFLGLILLPWSVRRIRPGSALLSLAIVVVATGTLFWPILIGPAIAGELDVRIGTLQLSNYLGLMFILTLTMGWIVLSDLREDLLPSALAFLTAVVVQVVVQAGNLAVLLSSISPMAESLGALLTHAGLTASFLLIGLAGLLRVGSIPRTSSGSTTDELGRDLGTIPSWQMIMPYPLLIALLVVRVSMEVFEWQEQYRSGMVYGISAVVVLILIWQFPMLRYNQDLHNRLAESAIRDGLTNIYTHRALHDLLHVEVHRARRAGSPLAILFMDIDHFKNFNDTYGHRIGDRVLQRVSETLVDEVRAGDFVGRYGGEEFMVIAPNIDYEDTVSLAHRLRSAIENNTVMKGDSELPITVSVGVACFPTDAATPLDLIDRADKAMYRAKQSGRNSVVVSAEPKHERAIIDLAAGS